MAKEKKAKAKRTVSTADGTKRNERLEKICSMDQAALKKWLKSELKNKMGREVVEGDGFLYSPGIAETETKTPASKVMCCAHMDTVHKNLPSLIRYEKGKMFSPDGIGGDDRCGVYMCLETAKAVPEIHLAFFEDEEIGGKGAEKFCKTRTCLDLNTKLNYIIEFDRKGSRDAVFYECDNPAFENFVTENGKGFFKTAWGSFSDICEICPLIGVAGVNLSCGYYNQHRNDEYIVLAEMEKSLEEAVSIIKRETGNVFYEYIEREHYWRDYYSMYGLDEYGYSYKNSDSSYSEEPYLIMYSQNGETYEEEVFGITEFEAVGFFLIDHPDMKYSDIMDVIPE